MVRKNRLKTSGLESLRIDIKAHGGEPVKAKAIMKKDARDDRTFKCDAVHFTYKVKHIILNKDEIKTQGIVVFTPELMVEWEKEQSGGYINGFEDFNNSKQPVLTSEHAKHETYRKGGGRRL